MGIRGFGGGVRTQSSGPPQPWFGPGIRLFKQLRAWR